MKYVFLCVMAAFFCVSPLHVSYAGNTPVQTLHDIQQALDTGDQAFFDTSINMESLIGQCVDIFIEDAGKADQKTLPPVLALMLSTVTQNETARKTLRDTLVGEASAFVRYGVRSGAFGGKEIQTEKPGGLLSTLFAEASMGRKEITAIGQPVEESGAVYIPFTLKDHGNGNSYPVEAWLRQENGNWRVIGLRNVRSLVRIIRGEKAQPATNV